MTIAPIATERLLLRAFTLDDASFIVRLLNEPSWIRYIGDKGVRTLDDARDYLRKGPLTMYERHGLGLLLVASKDSGQPIGMCGLIKRDALEDVDIGFALLPAYWGGGYALEAAGAALAHGRDALRLARVVAITDVDNERSIRLLERLGLAFERLITLPGSDEMLRLHVIDFARAGSASTAADAVQPASSAT